MARQTKKTELSTSESLLRRSFEPLLSTKDNKGRLTFIGYQHSILEWKKDGQSIAKAVLKLVFNVRDKTHENPANIAITCDYRYNPNNRLGTTLNLMGFEVVEKVEIVDADDEFGAKLTAFDSQSLFDFLRESAGLVYKASLKTAQRKDKLTGEKKEAKGLWDIDFTSIEPFISKDGNHLRDTDADKLGSAVTAPRIDSESESD